MISVLLSFLLAMVSHPCKPDYLSTKCVVFVAAVIFLDIPYKPNILNSRRCETKVDHGSKFQTLQKRQLSLWNTSPLVFTERTFSSQIYLFRLCLCWCKLSWYTSPDNWRGFLSAPITALFSFGDLCRDLFRPCCRWFLSCWAFFSWLFLILANLII